MSTIVLVPQLRLAAELSESVALPVSRLSSQMHYVPLPVEACGILLLGWRSEISFVLEKLFVPSGP